MKPYGLNWLQKAAAKALRINWLPGSQVQNALLRRTRFDYRKEVGDLIDASVVTAPVQWVQRSLPEARLTVRKRASDGKADEQAQHPMLALIQRPNPYYGDLALWSGTIFSYLTDGNGYWIKLRNGLGRPGELWYVPHWTMEPKGSQDGSEFLSHYEYRPGDGTVVRYAPEDIVHFRHGIDPRNPRKGLSPLAGAIREIFMDLESSNFVASLLRNMGVPGMVISPKAGGVVSSDDVAATKAWIKQAFGGDRRGEPLVMGAPTDVYPYGFNPQQMNMGEARDIAEERICALLGVPAAVVGFGAGLQSTKVGATMEELRKLAWQNGVLPVCRVLADELDRSLLPDFGNATGLNAWWDTSEVQALQDDLVKLATRMNTAVGGGWAQVAEGREAMGWDVTDADRIYLRPAMSIETPAGTAPPPTPGLPDGTVAPTNVQATALNGAQVQSLQALLAAVAGGTLPAETARAAISAAFPLMSSEEISAMMTPLANFTPSVAQPALPAPGGDKALTPRARKAAEAFVRTIQRQEGPLTKAMDNRLTRFFSELGKEARAKALPLLERELGAEPKAVTGHEEKADSLIVEAILDAFGINAHRTAFKGLFEGHFIDVAKGVADAAALAGISGSLPDPVARAVAAAGGKRAGMIDLGNQSRKALFDAIAAGRAEGEGAEALAGRIAQHIEAGPWASVETRARTIARTETKYAQNVSTIERAKAANVDRFIVFDGRLGPGRSDPDHIARDGSIVSGSEASQMAADEHPNGTLSFAPYFGEEP